LIFFASSAPSFIAQITTEKRPLEQVAVGGLARVFETVGLSVFLTWWGTRPNPFESEKLPRVQTAILTTTRLHTKIHMPARLRMPEHDDDLLAIEVDADSYATAAVQDTPTVSRTHQTEEAFQAIRATYQAKQHNGNLYAELVSDVPELSIIQSSPSSAGIDGLTPKLKLDKRQQALFGYVVGELYYDREYDRIVRLCERADGVCVLEGKFEAAVQKWKGRAQERMRAKGAETG
ncbi:hypothetical protein LTR95_017739, partial [Oleoguttula sp. CCFEE 5521]